MAKYSRFTVPTRVPKKNGKGLTVIVLSASAGYRMRSLGPKLLFKAADGSSILENIVNAVMVRFSGAELIYTIGFQADKVIRNKPPVGRLVENQLYEDTNSIEECRLALNNCECENALIINGDLLFDQFILDPIDLRYSSIIYDNSRMPADDVGVTVVQGEVTAFSYGLDSKWCYITYLKGKELSLFKSFCANRDNRKKFVWEGLQHIVDAGGTLKAIENIEAGISRIVIR